MVFTLREVEPDLSAARLDLRLLPVGLLLGLTVGVVEGTWRLHAIRRALPELDGKFFLREGGVLRRYREGENAITLGRIGFGMAFGIWFILTLHTGGRVMLFGTLAFYILGEYLTGRFLPFARLFLELRKRDSAQISGSN